MLRETNNKNWLERKMRGQGEKITLKVIRAKSEKRVKIVKMVRKKDKNNNRGKEED